MQDDVQSFVPTKFHILRIIPLLVVVADQSSSVDPQHDLSSRTSTIPELLRCCLMGPKTLKQHEVSLADCGLL
jgi:hypothetical protein